MRTEQLAQLPIALIRLKFLGSYLIVVSKPILVGFGLFFNLRCLGIITMSFDSGLPNYFLYMQCVF